MGQKQSNSTTAPEVEGAGKSGDSTGTTIDDKTEFLTELKALQEDTKQRNKNESTQLEETAVKEFMKYVESFSFKTTMKDKARNGHRLQVAVPARQLGLTDQQLSELDTQILRRLAPLVPWLELTCYGSSYIYVKVKL